MNQNKIEANKEQRPTDVASGAVLGVRGKDCCGQDIIPRPGRKLSAHRNRHPNCDGTGWGWIEGCTLNICWSNNNDFNEQKAYALVHRYNTPND